MSAEECDHIVKLAGLQGLHESTTLPVPEDEGTGEKCLLTTSRSACPLPRVVIKCIVKFQKIFIPTPRKVSGNSKREGPVSEA